MVPEAEALQQSYQRSKLADPQTAFPYWAKIWPAAYALADYIDAQPELVKNKRVLELAAGLGLPAMLASQYASQVTGSDYQADAVALLQKAIVANGILNMDARCIDWRQLPQPFLYDVVLLSDINYEPAVFNELFEMILKLQNAAVSIALSTPQRLLARTFVERLLPYCKKQETLWAAGEYISLLQL